MRQAPDTSRRADRLFERTARNPVLSTTQVLGRALIGDEVPWRQVDAAMDAQTQVTTGRRIAVVGVTGGAGASTIATLVAHHLHTARGTGVALTALQAAADGLAWLAARTTPGAVPLGSEEHIAELTRSHAATIVDCGSQTTDLALVDPHVVVRVARHTVRGDDLLMTGATLAVSCPVLTVSRSVPRAGLRHHRPGVAPGDHVTVPHDHHLEGEGPINPARLAEMTRLSTAELAGLALRRAVGR